MKLLPNIFIKINLMMKKLLMVNYKIKKRDKDENGGWLHCIIKKMTRVWTSMSKKKIHIRVIWHIQKADIVILL